MLIALTSTTGAPQTYKREITKATLSTILHRRISTLKYLKNVHLSKEPWLDTTRIPREKFTSIYHPDFTRSYFALGANLGALSEIQYTDLRQFLNALQVVLHYFDYHDQKRITANKMNRQKQLKKALKNSGTKSESISSASSSFHSLSSGDSATISPDVTSSTFRNPFKGRKIFGGSKKKDSESVPPTLAVKTVTKKKSAHFGGLFSRKSRRGYANDDDSDSDDDSFRDLRSEEEDDNLTPILSNTPSMATALAAGAFRTNSRSGTPISNAGLFPTSSTTSSSSSSTAVSNTLNEVNGTGTYTMGRAKKRYHQNLKAEHSTINQNMLSRPSVPGAMQRTPMLNAILDNLIVVSESNLPFRPDTVESIISLLDMMITIYRSLAHSLDQAGSLTRPELLDIDVALAGVEVILRRLVVTDALLTLDAECLRLRGPRSRDMLERDILKHSSNPNRGSGRKGDNKFDDQRPTAVIPQSHAMYV